MTSRAQRRSEQLEFAAALRARGIDREDHELLSFAVSWLPYGGGPSDEILIRFGLTKERYLMRLRRIVDEHRDHIHPDTAARLREDCDAAHRAPHAEGREAQLSSAPPQATRDTSPRPRVRRVFSSALIRQDADLVSSVPPGPRHRPR